MNDCIRSTAMLPALKRPYVLSMFQQATSRLPVEPQPADLVRLLCLEPDPQQDLVMIRKDDVVDHGIKAIAAIHNTFHFARIIAAQTGKLGVLEFFELLRRHGL